MSEQTIQRKMEEISRRESEVNNRHAELLRAEAELLARKQMLEDQWKELQASNKSVTPTIANTVGRIGNLNEYTLQEDFSLWCERLEQYVLVNEIDERKRVPLFLTLFGTEGYALLRNLCTPSIPSTQSYEDLKKIMSDHLQPKPSIITERYKFKECRQSETENVKQYLAKLQKLSRHCDFGAGLDNHLRDQFLWGVKRCPSNGINGNDRSN